MKRYHVSFLRHTIFYIISLSMFIFMGVKELIYPTEGDGFMSFIFPFLPFIWFATSLLFTLTLINVYRKRIYLEVNESSIIYSYGKNKIVYSYDDAKYYTIRPSGKQRILNVYSIKKDKNVKIYLAMFNIDQQELILLISDYSGKEVYYKDYGEEPELINKV